MTERPLIERWHEWCREAAPDDGLPGELLVDEIEDALRLASVLGRFAKCDQYRDLTGGSLTLDGTVPLFPDECEVLQRVGFEPGLATGVEVETARSEFRR